MFVDLNDNLKTKTHERRDKAEEENKIDNNGYEFQILITFIAG